jgi:hypothetical protein
VVLIFVFLMITDVEHFYINLLDIYISSLRMSINSIHYALIRDFCD